MLKPFLLIAVTANIILIDAVAARKVRKTSSSSHSSSHSSQSFSSSSTSTSVTSSDCHDDDNYSCGGDPNAQPGCDKLCEKRCVNQETPKCSCPTKNSCECKPGYVFDAVIYKCVHPKNCTITKSCSKKNEVYDSCPAPCPPRRCDVDERVIRCAAPPKPGDPECKPGCRCADNFFRNDKGICVRRENCPQKCDGPNEVFDECPAQCPPQRCDVDLALILCVVPPQPGDPECKPGCRCIDDYVRNSSGICIPRDQCEPQCPDNEVYNECPDLVCDPQKCTQLGYGVNCTVVDEDTQCTCEPGCICEYGYLRNKKGVCIPQNQCPTCKGDSNATAGCGIYCNQRCSSIGKEPESCILMCYPNACDCKPEYFLDDNTGKCVLPADCTPTCKKHEVYSECINGGCEARNCSQLGYPVPCVRPKKCIKGCICENNYLRNDKGVCVHRSKCPSCGGDPNAKPGCGVNCGKHCADYFGYPLGCKKICKPDGCDCKKDFYYDDNYDKCVPPEECTPYCRSDKNEIFSECINGGCQAKNCSQLGKPIPCVKIDPKYCIKGCICKEGYLRGSNGSCIPEDQCKPCTRPQEIYDKCPPICPPQTCESIGKSYSCPAIIQPSGKDCKPACRCVKGFFRNKIGECISKANCLKCSGRHEYYSCGSACDNVCETIKKQNQTNCPIKNITCNKKCYCEKGFARAKNKTCIPISKCDEPQCAVNEEYVKCPSQTCRPVSCSNTEVPTSCKGKNPCPEKPGCVCIKGYVRNDSGVCIPIEQCPTCGGDRNATSGCGFCGQYCSDIGKGPMACPAVCILDGCRCKAGYNYDTTTEKCVLPQDCTPSCGQNEKYENCPAELCRPKSCTEVGFPINCPDRKPGAECPGKPGCVCIDGYARHKKGVCVPLQECPSCRGDYNATSGCGFCGHRCSDIGKDGVACPKICEVNGCQCKKGYYHDEITKKCVLPNECCHCGLNEEFVQCPAGLCRPQNCSQLGFPIYCSIIAPDSKCPVKPSCVCVKGYARNSKGICVPLDKCSSCGGDANATSGCGYCGHRCSDIGKDRVICPRICELNGCQCKEGYYYDTKKEECVAPQDCPNPCDDNEEISTCVNGGCDKRNCTQLGKPTICIDPIKCKVGCVCKQGYLKDPKGICVPKKECPSCGGDPNAQTGCGNHCNRRCSDIGKKNKVCPLACKLDGCDCKPGYYLDDVTGKCVKPENCSCPKQNEVFKLCPSTCPPQTCESLDRAYICPIEFEKEVPPCTPGCVCKLGYYRNRVGQCNTEAQCRQCNGPNEFYDCGVECDNECDKLSEQNQTKCPIINIQCNPKCYCEKDYARAKNKTCIPISRCNEPQCGVNEIYVPCPAHRCRPENCSQVGYPLTCGAQTTPERPCPDKPKCMCIDGYVENDKGVCIPDYKCPKCGGDPNATPGCGLCFAKQCPGHSLPCATVCFPNSCVCKENYFYDRIKHKCVPLDDCTPICPKNEVPSDCVNGGCGKRNCSQIGQPDICIDVIKCFKGCVCKEGYLRNDNGVCVPINKCPPICPKNEVPSDCVNGGCGKRNCSQIGQPDICIDVIKCFKGCVCKEGYLRNDNGVCVPINKCPPICPKNEVPSDCVNGGCGKRNCSQIGQPDICIDVIKCFKGCVCKEGYLRNDNGVCVPINKCPPPPCPKHEVLSKCANGGCKKRNCSQLGLPSHCIDSSKCKKGCVCQHGYLRNDKGICVEIKQCTSCGGDPNARAGCGINCNRHCSDIGEKPKLCTQPCLEDGCDCIDGYSLDDNTGKCVPSKNCTAPCRDDEIFNTCIQAICRPVNCSQLGQPIPCPRINPEFCKKGCICKGDNVRAANGACIPKKKCPSCGGDPNAQHGCGKNCNKLCSDVGNKPKPCNDTCESYTNRCDCKCGFYLDPNTRKCVQAKDCTPECNKPHEVFDKCPPSCPPQTCSSIGKKYFCPKIPVNGTDCKPACRCEKNYFRNLIGECISRENCSATTPPAPPSASLTELLEKFRKANINLNLNFAYQLLQDGKSFILSGLSVLIAYAQLLPYSIGEARVQLLDVTNLDNNDEVKKVIPELLKRYREQRNVSFELAIKTYGNKKYPLNKAFLQDAVDVFQSEAQNLDFSNNVEAADIINDWVENKTQGQIQNLISPSDLSEYTRLVLVNALYFYGKWIKPFNVDNTQDRDFYISPDETTSIPFMYQENTFNYCEFEPLNTKVLEMKYDGGNFSLVIWLPNDKFGLQNMLYNMTADSVVQTLECLNPKTVRVYVPKMNVESELDVAELSKKANVTEMFNPASNSFQGILDKNETVFVSKAVQKAKFITDEIGTTAAAATGIIAGTTSAIFPQPETKTFDANHPHMFAIFRSGEPVFLGSFCG